MAGNVARLYPALKSEIGDFEHLREKPSQFPLFICLLRNRFCTLSKHILSCFPISFGI
jgi:hypothetical protein